MNVQIIVATAVFLSMILVDLAWAVYIRALAKDNVLTAAFYSLFIMLCGAFTSINYISNHWMLIPAAAGGFVGTLLCKKVEKLLERVKKE